MSQFASQTSEKVWKLFARCAETPALRISRKTSKPAVIFVKGAIRRRMLWLSHQTRKLWRDLCLDLGKNKDRSLFTAEEGEGSVLGRESERLFATVHRRRKDGKEEKR